MNKNQRTAKQWQTQLKLAEIPDSEFIALLEQISDDNQSSTNDLETSALLLTPATPETITSMLEQAVISQSLSKMLKNARLESGMTLAQVSERMGVSRGRIGQLESEGANLEAQTLTRLADALEYDVVLTLKPRVAGRQTISTELRASRAH